MTTDLSRYIVNPGPKRRRISFGVFQRADFACASRVAFIKLARRSLDIP